MIYDIIIIWAWAAGLFSWINLPKNMSKLILEKNKHPWVKVLLSGWERANVSNMDIEVERDYFTQNKKALLSVFKKYNQWDIQSFFAENWIDIIEEDRWRLILESWDSKELLSLLIRKVKENKCEIRTNSNVKIISPHPNPLPWWERGQGQLFEIETETWEKYECKNIIVSTWWKSFFQVWTTGEWYNFAWEFWLNIISPTRALVWLSTKKDFKELSGSSLSCEIKLIDKVLIHPPAGTSFEKGRNKKEIYSEFWPLLFTHFWISWPIVFNTANALWEYLNSPHLTSPKGEGLEKEADKIKYILENIKVELRINPKNSTKKINKFFSSHLSSPEGEEFEQFSVEFWLQDWRSWKEAKATGWWIDLNELDKNFMAKKVPWLYFIWEVIDVVGKTWGFNLQWAWSSWYVCGKSFE